MPEMRFEVRWPDGTEQSCYSPSLVIRDHLAVGAGYEVAEFLVRSRTALGEASERVRRRFGFPCARALAQLAEIERRGAAFANTGNATVTVLGFHEADGASP